VLLVVIVQNPVKNDHLPVQVVDMLVVDCHPPLRQSSKDHEVRLYFSFISDYSSRFYIL
jgi:hypothetical protein